MGPLTWSNRPPCRRLPARDSTRHTIGEVNHTRCCEGFNEKHARHETMSKIYYSLYDRLLHRRALAQAFAKVRYVYENRNTTCFGRGADYILPSGIPVRRLGRS